MHWTGWVVVLFAFLEGGWFAFDGGHALVTGDYVTPSSGQYADQLGPWSKLVAGLGIETIVCRRPEDFQPGDAVLSAQSLQGLTVSLDKLNHDAFSRAS